MDLRQRRNPENSIQPVRRNDGTLARSSGFVLPKKKAFSACFLWAVGLYFAFFAVSPVVLTQATREAALDFQNEADLVQQTEVNGALQDLMEVQHRRDEVKVWFWRLRGVDPALVERLDHAVALARRDYDTAAAHRDQLMNEARSIVGLWSEHGIADVRATFWRAFDWGKSFATQMSVRDVIFGMIFSRGNDREGGAALEMLVMLGRVIMNFVFGAFLTFVNYLWHLWSIMIAYQPGYGEGALFLSVAVLSAASVLIGWLLLVFGTGGAIVYGAGYALVHSSRRIENQQQRRFIR